MGQLTNLGGVAEFVHHVHGDLRVLSDASRQVLVHDQTKDGGGEGLTQHANQKTKRCGHWNIGRVGVDLDLDLQFVETGAIAETLKGASDEKEPKWGGWR